MGNRPRRRGAWRVVTVLQFAEGLPDRQAADAVRSRLDWKYALSLELTDSGFDHTVLSEFRTRLVAGKAEERLLDLVLEQARARGWLTERGTQRTDSTHILAAVRALTRLECVGETLRHTRNVLAEVAPEWLRAHARAGGWSATRTASRSIAYPAAKPSASGMPTRWARTAGTCSTPWKRRLRLPGCASCRQCRRCAECGPSSIIRARRAGRARLVAPPARRTNRKATLTVD